MREREPMTQTMKASEARGAWSKLLNQVFRRETRVVVEKHGIPIAAIISAEDLRMLNELEAERRRRFEVLDEIRGVLANVSTEDLEQEVEQAITEARKANRPRGRRARRPA